MHAWHLIDIKEEIVASIKVAAHAPDTHTPATVNAQHVAVPPILVMTHARTYARTHARMHARMHAHTHARTQGEEADKRENMRGENGARVEKRKS